MTVPVLSAAKRLGKTSGWSLTNLHMQKMCYIAHMFHLGNEHAPLVDGHFEAWKYGPVHPVLYDRLKKFGPYPVTKAPFMLCRSMPEGHSGIKYLDSAVGQLQRIQLVAIAHWEKGAWAKNYDPQWKGIVISNDDILEEFQERKAHAEKSKQQ